MNGRPLRSTLFPYTTLCRSCVPAKAWISRYRRLEPIETGVFSADHLRRGRTRCVAMTRLPKTPGSRPHSEFVCLLVHVVAHAARTIKHGLEGGTRSGSTCRQYVEVLQLVQSRPSFFSHSVGSRPVLPLNGRVWARLTPLQ